jgi:hypothetical protein
MRFLIQGLNYWTDGTIANDLAEGAQWSNILAWV